MFKGVSSKIVETIPSDIVNEECADCTAIIGTGNRSEILLSGCVPDLELDALSINDGGLRTELHSDSHIVDSPSLVFDELKYDTRFTNTYAKVWNTCVTNDNELEQIVVCVHNILNCIAELINMF